jgi:cytochrome oxidase Cu insertion factor (SCO1/SenC/PrrC family)
MGSLVKLRLHIKKNVILLFVFGIAAVLLPSLSNALSDNPLSDAGFMDFKEKKAAPDFILKDLEDNPIRLESFKGKVVLLYFWTTW